MMRSMLHFAQATPREMTGDGVKRRASRSTVVALRVVQRARVGDQLVEARARGIRALVIVHDREPNRFARAWGDGNAVLERAEDSARDVLGERRRDLGHPFLAQRAANHRAKKHLFAQSDDDRIRFSRTAPPARRPGLFVEHANVVVGNRSVHFLFGFAIEALTDDQRPRKDRDLGALRRLIVQGHVDDEGDGAIVTRSVRDVEALGDANALVEREFRDLRVGQEGELALDLTRKERVAAIAQPVRDLMRSEDDLVGIRVPQPAHAAFGRRRGERLKVAERQPERRFVFRQDVCAKFIPLGVEAEVHKMGSLNFAAHGPVHAESA
jgi:hypothetical protein